MPRRRKVLLARVVAGLSTVSFTTWPGAEKDAASADPSAVEYFLVKVIASGTTVAVERDPRPLRLTFRQESAQTLFYSEQPHHRTGFLQTTVSATAFAKAVDTARTGPPNAAFMILDEATGTGTPTEATAGSAIGAGSYRAGGG